MNKDFQGPLYCLKKPVHSPVEKNAGWAIYGEGKGAQTKTEAAWPGLQWCNFSTNTCSPWKFFELYLPCPNTFSSSEIPQIVYPNKEFSISSQSYCLQPTLHIHWSPGDVDISPRHQPIRGRYMRSLDQYESPGKCLITRCWGYSSRRWEGRCGYFLVVTGAGNVWQQTINDDI